MHAGVVVPRQEAPCHPLASSRFGKRKGHENSLTGLRLHHGAVFMPSTMRIGLSTVVIRFGRSISVLCGVIRMLVVTRLSHLDRLDIDVQVREEILPGLHDAGIDLVDENGVDGEHHTIIEKYFAEEVAEQIAKGS